MKKKILMVEKDKDLRDIMRLNLEQEGRYEITGIADAWNIIEVVKELRPHLIILGLLMESEEYIKICELLYNDDSFRDIPVIILAALNREREKACVMNIVDYLVKPVEIVSLIASIDKALK